MKKIIKSKYIVAATLGLFLSACTNLDEQVRDEVLGAGSISGEATLASVYDRMGDGTFVDNGGMIAMQDYASDMAMLPTRGADWGDGGKWREMHEFTWTPASPVINDNWLKLTNGISRSINAIGVLNAGEDDNKQLFLAEAKAMLAFYTFHCFDLFGQAPYRDPFLDPVSNTNPTVMRKASEYIDQLILDLEEQIPNLATLGESRTHTGRFTKEAAYALLADMYLNRAVFKDRYNATSDFDYTEAAVSGTGNDMDRVIYYTSLLINNGRFKLAENYFANFSLGNDAGSEHIFAIAQKVDGIRSGDNDLAYMSQERNQRQSPKNRGTNGSCITPEFFASWEGNHEDPRFTRKYRYADGTWFKNDGSDTSVPATDRVAGTSEIWFHFNRGIQYGQQYGPNLLTTGKFEMDGDRVKVVALNIEKNTKTPMDFTPEMKFDNPLESVLSTSQLNQGARCFKWEFDPASFSGAGNGESRVDVPLYRLGHMYIMRAEAYFRNGVVASALDDVNILRTSRKREAELYDEADRAGKALVSLDEAQLYKEIGFETYWEMKRRPQMIRFGKAENAGTAKSETQPFRRIFPIPQSTIDVSKYIKQNSGYAGAED
ncbi:RagB/SusD family nutrient uptake outer membrane protein [Parachryseolinea silvisoli]|uniref:RagB/SusD family nutrient uptake outer membrane protein n=1 Tax=Parachryseolinea silvisoli TaxID=2873601 RepID=UPI002265A486|nr:RagB/SusD family nutrient uptake outer membrane protein [Parachryseolinea silvisoli]MCD9014696.1 RagB/SusD family nutrient uptake outer membrane protein [Parachryseolinea silvisoli]